MAGVVVVDAAGRSLAGEAGWADAFPDLPVERGPGWRARAVVVAGGELGGPRAELHLLARLALARVLGQPSAMVGVRAGPAAGGLSRWAITLAGLASVADEASRARLTQLGVRRPLPVHPAAEAAHWPALRQHLARGRQGGALAGGAVLFLSATLVNLGNYVFNLVLGRWLGPAAFADLSLAVTLTLMAALFTATLQTVAARFSATHTAAGAPALVAGVRRWLGRVALIVGLVMAVVFVAGAPGWQAFFRTASPGLFVLLGLGLPIYLVQGVERGVLQGQTRFGPLALSYQAEMWTRLGLALVLVALGAGVDGAVLAVALSFAAAWALARRAGEGLPAAAPLPAEARRAVLAFGGSAAVALIGQTLINNSDLLIVKRFFPPAEAGHYAALALIGRVVFFATWSVVTTLFPVVAQRHQRGEPHGHLLAWAMGLIVALSAPILVATLAAPEWIVLGLFGPAYLSIAPLLWLYALATLLYALANVVIHYRLSTGVTGGSVFSLAAGLAQVAALWLWHDSLALVVVVQLGVMAGLTLALLAWELSLRRPRRVVEA